MRSGHTLDIMSALGDGPKFAHELPGPKGRVSNRIRDCNSAFERIGSHWRIRGHWTHTPVCGMRVRVMIYRMVLES
jgi:hypothetical protein